MVDLITRQAWSFPESLGTNPQEIPLPDELVAPVEAARETMIERIAETDEALTTKFLEGEEITDDELRAALRAATIANKLVPVLCGTALRTKGVQLLLDAVLAYLPSPLDIPAVRGTNPDTR